MDAKIARVQSAAVMTRFACLFACLSVITGCQHGGDSSPPPAAELYRIDIANLCDVIVKAGTERMDPNERTLVIASWLAAHLQTEQAHDYLIKIQPLVGEAKAAALDAEARRVGLPRCALSEEWRGASAPAR